jgi:ferredoxin
MRIELDPDLCQGHGVCESEAPAVFLLGKDTEVRILKDEIGEDELASVRQAVRYCPNQALRLVDG